jgi:tripartite-type tricarboxylate transporter receptor subunit TctC
MFCIIGVAPASAYPDRPVTIIVPFGPGGDADIAARNLGNALAGTMKQPIVIVNKAGASGSIGSVAVQKSPPDGYTLLMARVGPQAILPALRPKLPYKWNDFTLIGILDLSPMVCVVHADSPYKTFDELAKALQAQPGTLNYSSSGAGTILHLAPLMIFQSLGMGKEVATHIAYKGGAEAALAVMSKEVTFSCGNLTSMTGHIKRGTLRALITTAPERLRELPDIPTARELNLPALEALNGWNALYGPPNLEKSVIARWTEALRQAEKDPVWIRGTERSGAIPRILSPADTEKFVAEQVQTYERLGQKLNIVLD